jgi:lipopolysaccharide transport system ATP-binding protein
VTAPFRNWRSFRQPTSAESESRNGEDDIHWALRDVSFEVKEGEVLGIIGRNGAGKSTLLKILSRITEPTSGCVRIRGRVSSLLEVGTGFHPELSGRENVYLNGTILGMTKREIDQKFDEIIGFSGVEKFLDTPVKRYSSGMKVRLAFAVAAHLEPEILVIDEVLAVGDATFQRRCIDRMKTISREGKTILFVSHNLDIVGQLCSGGVLLKEGRVVTKGLIDPVVSRYLEENNASHLGNDLKLYSRTGDGRARFSALRILDSINNPIEFHFTGSTLRISVQIDSIETLRDVGVAIVLSSTSGNRIVSSWSRETDTTIDILKGRNEVTCDFEDLRLRPGHSLWIGLWMEEGGRVLDCIDSIVEVIARSNDPETDRLSTDRNQGIVACKQHWRFRSDCTTTA